MVELKTPGEIDAMAAAGAVVARAFAAVQEAAQPGARLGDISAATGRGMRLEPGLTIAIEPWFLAGGRDATASTRTAGRWAARTALAAPTSSTRSR